MSCHLQRLPIGTIKRAQVLGKVFLQKDPRAADLGAGDSASLGALAEYFRVDAQKCGRFFESESVHWSNGKLIVLVPCE